MNRPVVAVTTAVATLAVAAICLTVVLHPDPAARSRHDLSSAGNFSSSRAPGTSSRCGHPTPPLGRYIGLASRSTIGYSLRSFTRMTRTRPSITTIYLQFGKPFPEAAACEVTKAGALPLLQIDPNGVSVTSISTRRWNRYLATFGAAVRAFGEPVALSFGHEANGNWYSWGCQQTPPSAFVSAWRRLHDAVADAGATHVIWVWTMNIPYDGSCPLRPLWPGSKYVTWAGLDAYLDKAGATFQSDFVSAITRLRTLTRKPVLLAEVGVTGGQQQPSLIRGLFAGAARYPGLVGIVYFDGKTSRGDYMPQDYPPSRRAFSQAARAFETTTRAAACAAGGC